MTLSIVGIEKIGDFAKVTLAGKSERSPYTDQFFMYINWSDIELFPLGRQMDVRMQLIEK